MEMDPHLPLLLTQDAIRRRNCKALIAGRRHYCWTSIALPNPFSSIEAFYFVLVGLDRTRGTAPK